MLKALGTYQPDRDSKHLVNTKESFFDTRMHKNQFQILVNSFGSLFWINVDKDHVHFQAQNSSESFIGHFQRINDIELELSS